MRCEHCAGTLWVCEEHPALPFGHDDCAGPGMPCACNPEARDDPTTTLACGWDLRLKDDGTPYEVWVDKLRSWNAENE